MENPWESVSLEVYEGHMSNESVGQLQLLKGIMKSQLEAFEVKSVAVFGVAGGNGLEYADSKKYDNIYGIDINGDYLEVCKKRLKKFGNALILIQADLSNESCSLPRAELIIANLLIEYMGVSSFVNRILKTLPDYVSCVIQKSGDSEFVSTSPYAGSLEGVSSLHRDIDRHELVECMGRADYCPILTQEHFLTGSKRLIRLDFEKSKLTR